MDFKTSKIGFMSIVITAIVFSLFFGFFTYKYSNDLYTDKVKELETNYFEKNKALVKSEVSRAIKRIKTLKQITINNNKLYLKEKVSIVESMLNKRNGMTLSQTLNNFKKELDVYKWDNDTGYFYIFNVLTAKSTSGSGRSIQAGIISISN